ncbi:MULTISPECIES: acyl carrier protein [unclassified Pseudomonas]|uniref:acyl carrier protein n=1 Tax=unclassified Pseudomonas TaxID=196821 RepID=UPI0021C9C210|nr:MULTISPECIES: acyl carrier protein [unclassified Pseudomonas]MCU1733361.1 acyl carrier protein [Pseudomonas sp. 20P_3.2_Bac4]MCU1743924.1 acyl carrier protein [Pseudomonas sp. 20P_3.2_Bac5]
MHDIHAKVREVVLKHTEAALAFLDLGPIDTQLRFDHLGASSLDIITIVSDAMRELQVKVPVEQLNQLSSIDALIDTLSGAVYSRVSV